MSQHNLHSLINGKWFIHEQYGKALLPSLFAILEGKSIVIKQEVKPEAFIAAGKNSNLIVADSFDSGKNQEKYAVVINLKNPIYKYDQECGPAGTKTKMRIMDRYAKDPNCVGVVLDIDSGGGQVSGTPEFYDFVKNFSKPVVAYTDGYMCSAAYYIGSSTSHIIANKRAEHIGSIGVMIHFIDVTGIYEKKGAKVVTEYATKSTEKNRAFEELLKGNPALYIKNELDPIAEEFIADIKAVRSGVLEDVFAGGTWNATQALDKKLIDEIGTLQTAIDKVFELASSSNNNSNKTQKKKTMSKTKGFPGIQKVLGIGGDGLGTISTMTGKKGVQITEAHLDSLEKELGAKDAAVTAAQGKVATAEGTVTTLNSAVDAAITSAGLTADVAADATTETKIALLAAKVTEYGTASGKITKPKAEGDPAGTETSAIVDANDAHNKLYNDL